MARTRKEFFTGSIKLNVEEGEAQEAPFSFPMLLASNSQRGGEQGGEEQLREVFIDMDVALPRVWESMKRQGSSKSSSIDSGEFDFSRSLCSLDPAPETPADELFYKGQLLPLQKRKDDHENEEEEEGIEDGEGLEYELESAKADSFSFKSQGMPELSLESCMSPDRFPSAAGGAESRSSSFRSSCSYWDSADCKEDSSSSCRDSNGSSQDSCFDQAPSGAAEMKTAEEESHRKQNEESQGSARAPTWRRSPFMKWKILGGSKRASLSASSSCSSTSSTASSSAKSPAAALKSLGSDRRRNHSFTYGSSSNSSSQLRLSSFFTPGSSGAEKLKQQQQQSGLKYRHSVSSASASSSLRSCDQDRESSSSASSAPSSSSGRVLHKYLKLLKPFVASSGNLSHRQCSYNSNTTTPTSSRRGDQFLYGTIPSPNPSSHRSSSAAAAARSLEEWRAAMAYYDQQREQQDKELITCPSFHFPGSLRVASFSSRRSSHTSCVTSSRSSPNHSGVLRPPISGIEMHPSSSSNMVDLQSAIQGAIAHCKRSHTPPGAASPAGVRSNFIAVPSSSAPAAAAAATVSSIDLGSTVAPAAAVGSS